MKERWRWIRKYKGLYKVSDHGRVNLMNRKERRCIRKGAIKDHLLPVHLKTPCPGCLGMGRRPGNKVCLFCGGSGINHKIFTHWGDGRIIRKDGSRRLVQFPQYTAAGTCPAGSFAVWVPKEDLVREGGTVKLATVTEIDFLDFIGILFEGKMAPEKRRLLKKIKSELAPIICGGPLACDVCRGRGQLIFLIPMGMQIEFCTDCEGTGSRTVEVAFHKFLKSLTRRKK